jgi:hypothetical protein
VLVAAGYAEIGEWQTAWDAIDKLDPAIYDGAGGNGHSRSNSLWYVASRPLETSFEEPVFVPSLPGENSEV